MRLLLIFILFLTLKLYAQSDSAMVVPFTLSDKIRLIRIEEQMNAKFQQIDKRFEQIDKRFDRLEDLVWTAIFAMFGSLIALVGFILWDRRTFLKPIASQIQDIQAELDKNKLDHEQLHKITQVLKEKAKDDDSFKELLKKYNL